MRARTLPRAWRGSLLKSGRPTSASSLQAGTHPHENSPFSQVSTVYQLQLWHSGIGMHWHAWLIAGWASRQASILRYHAVRACQSCMLIQHASPSEVGLPRPQYLDAVRSGKLAVTLL